MFRRFWRADRPLSGNLQENVLILVENTDNRLIKDAQTCGNQNRQHEIHCHANTEIVMDLFCI